MSHQKVTQATLVSQTKQDPHQGVEQIALFDSSGAPVTPQTAPDTGATVLMTGYTAHASGSVSAGDSVNVAIAKLEARLVAGSL